jgi:hypothetical protein
MTAKGVQKAKACNNRRRCDHFYEPYGIRRRSNEYANRSGHARHEPRHVGQDDVEADDTYDDEHKDARRSDEQKEHVTQRGRLGAIVQIQISSVQVRTDRDPGGISVRNRF